MLIDVGSLAILGATLGTVLAVTARVFAVEENPLEHELLGILPGAQCGQCGYVGCGQAAAALATGEAPVTLCPPGGKAVAEKLAQRLGVSADLSEHEERGPEIAFVKEDLCIGCLRCIQACTADAIVGGPKQLHTVIADACHACRKCFSICPTEAIEMRPLPETLGTWHWHKPGVPADAVH
ncbi:MAG TPA: RnfABCDGE type electron transport complex subunit B [Azospirillaceae bacterium]|nr:RnfABCDGE type electron transport complex subunit B [Azospirillaceae bacterium]